MDFNIDGVFNVIEQRFGKYISTSLLALFLLWVACFLISSLIEETIIPAYKFFETASFHQIKTWSGFNIFLIVYLLIFSFLALMRAVSRMREKTTMDRLNELMKIQEESETRLVNLHESLMIKDREVKILREQLLMLQKSRHQERKD